MEKENRQVYEVQFADLLQGFLAFHVRGFMDTGSKLVPAYAPGAGMTRWFGQMR
ncbi:hypothetical protein IMCC21906_02425 [Spongiibacter sp. IMCC21906]|nr:hypothetical protein IMCC21906_02425 [Spongiibacter sp. IMCC21906]